MAPPISLRPRMIVQTEEHYSARQHIGDRPRQEDFFAFARVAEPDDCDAGLLAVVADGMGGHAEGSFASRLATNTFVDAFRRHAESPAAERLGAALAESNDAILRATEAAKEPVGCMGTTLVAVLVTREGLHWVSVGDSAIFVFRDGQLRRLNADHSFRPLIEDQIERGFITREQARDHPNCNTLRSAVTGFPIDLIDLSLEPMETRDDDLVICASDGLFSLSVAGLANELSALHGQPANAVASGLIDAALDVREDYQDNITVAVVKPDPWVRAPGQPDRGDEG